MALNGFGLGSSFPVRYEPPKSTTVGYLPDAETWNTGWDKRYAAEAARARPAGPTREQYIDSKVGGALTSDAVNNYFSGGNAGLSGIGAGDYYNMRPDVLEHALKNNYPGASGLSSFANLHYTQSGKSEGTNPAAGFDAKYYLAQNPDVAKAGADPLLHYMQSGQYEGRKPSGTGQAFGGAFQSQSQDQFFKDFLGNDLYNSISNYKPAKAYTPDFTALNAEKTKMTPLLQSQVAQQQAYGNQTGNGQLNGVIGPGYTAPDFGQVNGQIGSNDPTKNAPAGIDPSWSSGVYNPQGTYNPQNSQKWGWGL